MYNNFASSGYTTQGDYSFFACYNSSHTENYYFACDAHAQPQFFGTYTLETDSDGVETLVNGFVTYTMDFSSLNEIQGGPDSTDTLHSGGVHYRVTHQVGKNIPLTLVWGVPAAGGLLLYLPTAQRGSWNIPNLSQREVFTVQMCHPVVTSTNFLRAVSGSIVFEQIYKVH